MKVRLPERFRFFSPLIPATYANINGALVVGRVLGACLTLVCALTIGCKFSGSAGDQQDSSRYEALHPAVRPLAWDTLAGVGDTVLWSHVAIFAMESVEREYKYRQIESVIDSATRWKGCYPKPFANLKVEIPKNCKSAYNQAPIFTTFCPPYLLVELADFVYDSIDVESISSHLKISLKGKRECNARFVGGEACMGKTLILIKQKALQRVVGGSVDGAVGFDLHVSGDSLYSSSKKGEWHCFPY